jgi:hypothetical protein
MDSKAAEYHTINGNTKNRAYLQYIQISPHMNACQNINISDVRMVAHVDMEYLLCTHPKKSKCDTYRKVGKTMKRWTP